jgi:hypothetical protein
MQDVIKSEKIHHIAAVKNKIITTDGLPFSQILSASEVDTTLQEQQITYRNRFFSPLTTLWTFLSQVMEEDQSCQRAVGRFIAFLVQQDQAFCSPNTAAYCRARERLSEEFVVSLTRKSGAQLEEQAPVKWLWRDRHVKLTDGSTLSMPDTVDNQAAYPQPDTQKPGVGFPITRIVALISLATGAVLDFAMGTYQGKGTGEHALLRSLLDNNLAAGDILLGDEYYCSFFLIALLIEKGVDVVFPLHHARHIDFRCGQALGKRDHIVEWKKPVKPEWMDEKRYQHFPATIRIRETEVRYERTGFRTKTRILATTFLGAMETTPSDLAELYDFRWLVEIDFRAIKQTMKMDVLRGKTPAIVRKEIWVHLLAYNLIRKVMAQAALEHELKPRQLSFKLALQIIESFRQVSLFSEQQKHYKTLLELIAYKTIGNRPGRYEPRRIKRRPKAFNLLQKPRWKYKARLSVKNNRA